jgi:hypothetical protein
LVALPVIENGRPGRRVEPLPTRQSGQGRRFG